MAPLLTHIATAKFLIKDPIAKQFLRLPQDVHTRTQTHAESQHILHAYTCMHAHTCQDTHTHTHTHTHTATHFSWQQQLNKNDWTLLKYTLDVESRRRHACSLQISSVLHHHLTVLPFCQAVRQLEWNQCVCPSSTNHLIWQIFKKKITDMSQCVCRCTLEVSIQTYAIVVP